MGGQARMVAARVLVFTAMMAISLPAMAAENLFSLAKDTAYVRYSAGWFDIKADKDAAPEFSLEYHDDTQLGWFKTVFTCVLRDQRYDVFGCRLIG